MVVVVLGGSVLPVVGALVPVDLDGAGTVVTVVGGVTMPPSVVVSMVVMGVTLVVVVVVSSPSVVTVVVTVPSSVAGTTGISCWGRFRYHTLPPSRDTAQQAAEVAAALVGFQNGPVDSAAIYDARCGVVQSS